jgi:hypothetical protein
MASKRMRHQTSFGAVAAMALVIPASAAFAQYTGTSHPDEVPVTTSPEGVRQPLVYVPAASVTVSTTGQSIVATAAPAQAMAQVEASAGPAVMVPANSAYAVQNAQFTSAPPVSDGDGGVVIRVSGPANAVPEGTLVKTKLLQQLSTRSTVEGSEWRAEVLEPVMRDGRVLIPPGAVMVGKVTEVHGGKRISGEALIHLTTLSLVMPDGTTAGMHAQVIDTDMYKSTKVDSEGTVLRRDHKKEDGGILALTAGSGAAAGAMIAGVPGALVGAGIGAGVSTAFWLRQDRQAVLPGGTEVTFELTKSMAVGVE